MSAEPASAHSAAVHWHDAECGSYAADLRLWEALAAEADGPVLDLGCGTGRVAIHLSRRGHEVVGVDADEGLLAAMRERAAGQAVTAVAADVRKIDLGRRFDLVLAPMQLVQLMEGPRERELLLRRVAAHLAPGGTAALAIVEGVPDGGGPAPLPDIREVDGWVYSSLPLDVVQEDGAFVVRRLRQLLSPSGEISEEMDETRLHTIDAAGLENEAVAAGLRALERRTVAATSEHVGSTVVLLGGEA